MSHFEKNVLAIAKIVGMEGQENDVAYVLLELIIKRRLNWRKL